MLGLRSSVPCGSRLLGVAINTSRNNRFRAASSLQRNKTILINPSSSSASDKLQQQRQQRWYATSAEPVQKAEEPVRVYYGTLAPRMKAVKFFSLTTSLAGLAAQPILMEQGMKIGGTGMAVFFCTVAGFFTFVTPLLLHFVTKKYVTELHYNRQTDEYTATTISLLLTKNKTKFRTSDVTVPEVPGMFTSFHVGKRALFVDPALFEDPEHYVRIMGYDKPIDFKLDLNKNPLNPQKAKQPQAHQK